MTDPTSRVPTVRNKALVIMDGQAINPSVRAIYGAEQVAEQLKALQIQAMADRAATQVKIQRAVEGFSIIAISYYLLGLLKFLYETADHAGFHIDPVVMLGAVPVVVGAVATTILRVKHALKEGS